MCKRSNAVLLSACESPRRTVTSSWKGREKLLTLEAASKRPQEPRHLHYCTPAQLSFYLQQLQTRYVQLIVIALAPEPNATALITTRLSPSGSTSFEAPKSQPSAHTRGPSILPLEAQPHQRRAQPATTTSRTYQEHLCCQMAVRRATWRTFGLSRPSIVRRLSNTIPRPHLPHRTFPTTRTDKPSSEPAEAGWRERGTCASLQQAEGRPAPT